MESPSCPDPSLPLPVPCLGCFPSPILWPAHLQAQHPDLAGGGPLWWPGLDLAWSRGQFLACNQESGDPSSLQPPWGNPPFTFPRGRVLTHPPAQATHRLLRDTPVPVDNWSHMWPRYPDSQQTKRLPVHSSPWCPASVPRIPGGAFWGERQLMCPERACSHGCAPLSKFSERYPWDLCKCTSHESSLWNDCWGTACPTLRAETKIR